MVWVLSGELSGSPNFTYKAPITAFDPSPLKLEIAEIVSARMTGI
jgi:hypothetical protein